MCDMNSLATAALLDSIGGLIFTLGDNAYFHGSRAASIATATTPRGAGTRAGRFRCRATTSTSLRGALPYFEYFGEMASGPLGEGYYSFEVGDWHAVALNSNVAVGSGSAQATWLRTDLASSRARCTIAYWHHPLFTSGPNGDMPVDARVLANSLRRRARRS